MRDYKDYLVNKQQIILGQQSKTNTDSNKEQVKLWMKEYKKQRTT